MAIVRGILAVLAGLFVGSLVNMAIVIIGPILIPVPEGVDQTDVEKLKATMHLLQPVNFLPPFLAHAVGTLVGAFVAAAVAAGHRRRFALGIACFFLLGGISMVAMVGGPIWFAILDLGVAYLPMGYLGGALAGKLFGGTSQNATPAAKG